MQLFSLDGLRNIVANLGTSRDKASGSTYDDHTVNDDQLIAMYRTSAIAKKIVDLPAEDSLREWREWQAKSADITLIEAEETRLGLQGNLVRTSKRARLFGGAAIFISTADKDLTKPLDPSRIVKGGLKYLSVVNRFELNAGDIERDPRLPEFGKPRSYSMMTESGQIDIHPSRLVVLHGAEVPDDRVIGAQLGWSDPVLNSCLTNVRDMDATIGNVASLVFEAKINVIGIKGFAAGLQSGGPEFERAVLARQSLNATSKGVNGDLLMDTEDTFTTRTASFATLPDVIDRFMQMTSAASSIPMTLLFGMSAGGLNASGDSDTRGYYDRVRVIQTLELQPAMAILDECLIRSALGSRPDDVHYVWKPLWQQTAKEKADTGKILSETMKNAVEIDAVSVEAGGKALVNALTESGAFPGLEAATEEFPVEGDDLGEDDDTDLGATEND